MDAAACTLERMRSRKGHRHAEERVGGVGGVACNLARLGCFSSTKARIGFNSNATGSGGREEGGGEKGGGEKRERASIQFSSFPPQTPDIDRSEVRGSSITRSSGGEECIVRPIVHLSPDYRGQAVKPSGPQRETGESQER